MESEKKITTREKKHSTETYVFPMNESPHSSSIYLYWHGTFFKIRQYFSFLIIAGFCSWQMKNFVISMTLSTYKSVSMESFLYQPYVHIVCTFLV